MVVVALQVTALTKPSPYPTPHSRHTWRAPQMASSQWGKAGERKEEAPLEPHFQSQEEGGLSKKCFPENTLLKDKLAKKNSMAKLV